MVLGLATAVRGYLEGIADVLYSSIAGIVSLISRILASYGMAAVFLATWSLHMCGSIFLGRGAGALPGADGVETVQDGRPH